MIVELQDDIKMSSTVQVVIVFTLSTSGQSRCVSGHPGKDTSELWSSSLVPRSFQVSSASAFATITVAVRLYKEDNMDGPPPPRQQAPPGNRLYLGNLPPSGTLF